MDKIKELAIFKNSSHYWEKRYKDGGNSGAGSYNHLAEFKAEVINNFVEENNINNVIEFGCGDGNQLSLLKFKKYIGVDVSKNIILSTSNIYKNDNTKKFYTLDDFTPQKSELTLSLDVIFHLIEDDVFEKYIKMLFDSSDKYVIIYSSNTDIQPKNQSIHVKHRRFTEWVSMNRNKFKLIKTINNMYPFNGTNKSSFADFYVYEK